MAQICFLLAAAPINVSLYCFDLVKNTICAFTTTSCKFFNKFVSVVPAILQVCLLASALAVKKAIKKATKKAVQKIMGAINNY